MKKTTKILDAFFNNKTVKYLAIYCVALLIFYIIGDFINGLIAKYLTINERLLIQLPKTLVFSFFLITLLYILYKLILKKYQISLGVIHTIFSLSLFYLITRFSNYAIGWQYISFGYEKMKYVDFTGLILLLSTLIILTLFIIKYFSKEKLINNKNPFVSDDPILTKDEDKLNYQKRVGDIISYLERSKFNNSFTIGIVGPWGNGKSSLIALIEEELHQRQLDETIHLKFLPYLNHSETDIISEFFKQLSVEISKYSGKLSNQFLNYSDKLLKLYKNKNITEFLKPNSSLFSESSSYDTYKKINETLNELNKKFIIFIDDLDRLSNKEVLQVLKLVRNTANFKNFIFLIALDKDYVLESLIAKNDIADHTFVDKFFQLEVYLPEIEKSQLKIDFIEFLKKTDLHNQLKFISDVETSIYKQDNLFDDYISNHRGVKRLLNQLVFDYNSLPDELNTNDFLNFTYLKMTFPFAVKLLNRNWSKIIPFNPDTNLCELIESKDDNDNSSTIDLIKNVRMNFANSELNIDYGKYEMSKGISEQKQITETNNLSIRQNILLAKTLIVLFGKQNIAESHTSIRFENNLRKLLQQKVNENDLNEIKFRSIFNFDNDFENLKQLLEAGHCNNILNRIAYFNTKDIDETLKILIILLFIFNEAENYGTYFNNVWSILSDFINRQLKLKQGNIEVWKDKKSKIWEYLNQEFLNKEYKLERKIEFLALISQHRIKLSFSDWGTTEDNLKELSLYIFKELIRSKQNVLWDIHDYSFYHAYHNVRKFQPSDIINPLTIEFWQNNNITLLCAQMIQNDIWTTKMLKTSDYASQLFGSKKEYKDFVNENLPNPITPQLNEYKQFLELESLNNFSNYVRFEFLEFEFIKQKLQKVIDSNNMRDDEFEDIVEVVFKSNTRELGDVTRTNISINSVSGFIDSRIYTVEDMYYTFVKLKTETFHKAIDELFTHFKNLVKNEGIKPEISSNKKSLIIEGKDEKIEIISIQPKSYDTFQEGIENYNIFFI